MNQPFSAKEISHGAFWSVSNQIVGQVLSLVVFLITARFVSTEAFGIMAASMLAVEFFRQIFIESMATTVYARRAPDQQVYNASFFMIAGCGLASGLFVLLLAGPLSALFGHPEIKSALQWISVILMTMGLSKTHEIWLTKHLQFKTLALRSILSIAVGGGVGIYLAVHDYGLVSLLVQQIVTAVISLIWLWAACTWRPSLDLTFAKVVELFSSWKFLIANSLTSLLSHQSDIFFSALYLGTAATGIYNAAKRILAAISMVINGGINGVALPALTSHSGDKEQLRQSFLTCVSLISMLTAPLFVGLAVLSADFVNVLMGEKWIESAPVLSILSCAAFMGMLSLTSVNIMLIEQKAHWQTVIGILSTICNIGLLAILATKGLVWVAVALLIRTVIFCPVNFFLSLKLLSLSPLVYAKTVGLPLAFALVMGSAVYSLNLYTDLSSLLNLLLLVPAGAALYFLLYFLFARKTILQVLALVKTARH